MRGEVRKHWLGDWTFLCTLCAAGVTTFSWTAAMEAFWGHEIMRHKACPDCDGSGCAECARVMPQSHWTCYCVYCNGTGVVCSS